MACLIRDALGWFDGSSGSFAGQSGLLVYAYPTTNVLLLKDGGGVFRPIEQNPSLPEGSQWGRASTASASSTGQYDIYLPRDDEQSPAGTPWQIKLPDGKIYQGVPPNNNGALTIYDLQHTYNWEQVAGQQGTAATSDGYEAGGEHTFTGQDFYDVTFAVPMISSTYTISFGVQVDTSVGGGPHPTWSNRSKTGFRINLTAAFNGIVTYRCKVEQ